MRMVRPAKVSRAAALVTMGGKFTDKAGLTVACMSRPRNGDAPGKNGPSHNINDKNQPKQDEPGGASHRTERGHKYRSSPAGKQWAVSTQGSRIDCPGR